MSDEEMDEEKDQSVSKPEIKTTLGRFKLGLVQIVRDFPVIYTRDGTSSAGLRDEAWVTIAERMQEYFTDDFSDPLNQKEFCRKTWGITRGNFNREIRENKKKKPWWLRKHMSYLLPYRAEMYVRLAKIYGKKRWKKQDAESVEEENEDGEEADEDEYAHSADIDGSFLPQDEPSTITTISPISNRYTLRRTDKKSSASRMPSREFFRLGKATTHQNHASVVAQAMPSTVVLEDEADLQVRVWLTKLKRLPSTEQRRAMKKINDVLYEAEESALASLAASTALPAST